MRQLSEKLVRSLPFPANDEYFDENLIDSICRAFTQVRGRPVRLRKVAFPYGIASGVWINRAGHDLIAYEENTDPEHQRVIVAHEAWHMFQGHCRSVTTHGPAASRAGESPTADALAELVAAISAADDADLSATARTDAFLHFSARADATEIHEEREAELFGVRFATDVQAAVAEARTVAGLHNLAGRITASMAHRVRRF
ncbi:toxin-antitoxin system, toxin component [Streptomyces sp. MBT62]|uniref:toxin-antitoxin system, toxin component n=1 Tax=Streptomyces sp. MBT62 TaxID=2800410 RepID=UPI00190AFE83|nr:toxin-antitoxin system, toxin component [Streptomyces sp. MBT62]MBK3564467.1 toxin-antitoxin system, toxin component [Streptomyces sp. MBT62]